MSGGRLRAGVAAIAWLAAALPACQQRTPASGERVYYGRTVPRHGPTEVWTNIQTEPEWIDPTKCADHPGGTVITNVFAGLLQAHPQTLEPMPDVARSWELSPDGKVYTFHLRPSLWSDGVPLTARDFEYSWKRVLARDTASRYATLLYPLKNGEAFHQGKVPSFEVGVKAIDDLTLRVELEDPLPYFLDLTTYYTTFPVPRHVIDRLARAGLNTDLWTRVEHIVSNGPFVLTEWRFRQFMTLRRNPQYWDRQAVKLERVRLNMVESNNTVLNLYATGELDYVGSSGQLPSEFLDHLSRFADFSNYPQLAVYFYWFNVKAKPLDDARVRRALSLAVDRAQLVKYVTRAGQIPSADVVPDGLAGYRALRSLIFDPVEARRLLKAAGYGPGRPLPTITLRYNTMEQHKLIAEAVQQMWKKHLGVDVQIENQEWKVYLKALNAKDFQIARFGWIGDYPDPYTFLDLLASGNGNNSSNWSDPRYDALLRRANRTQDPAARLAWLREAEALSKEAAPLLPLYVYTRAELSKPYLMGRFSNVQARTLMKYWWIDPRWYHGVPAQRADDVAPPRPSRSGEPRAADAGRAEAGP